MRLLVGGEHGIDGGVAVGVDAHLEAGLMHLHHPFLNLVGAHGEDAMVAGAAHIGLGKVSGAGRNGPVGHHLDASDPQALVTEPASDTRVAQGLKMVVVHQQVGPQRQVATLVSLLVGLQLKVRYLGIMHTGQSHLIQHLADASQPLPAHIGGHRRQVVVRHRLYSPLVDDTVEITRGLITPKATARRV